MLVYKIEKNINFRNREEMFMQYETIILELLSRIKKLEDDVNELKQFQNDLLSVPNNDDENLEESDYQVMNDTTVSYKKMTDEMIDICYKCGKKVSAGESVQELADDIVESTETQQLCIYMLCKVCLMEQFTNERSAQKQ